MANKAEKKDFSSIALGFLSPTTLDPADRPEVRKPETEKQPSGTVDARKNRGGRPKENRGMVRFSLYIDPEIAAALRRRSEDTEVPVNKIMIRALREYLQNSNS